MPVYFYVEHLLCGVLVWLRTAKKGITPVFSLLLVFVCESLSLIHLFLALNFYYRFLYRMLNTFFRLFNRYSCTFYLRVLFWKKRARFCAGSRVAGAIKLLSITNRRTITFTTVAKETENAFESQISNENFFRYFLLLLPFSQFF